MFYILFYESEVIICKDFDEVMELIALGWTLRIFLHHTISRILTT